MVRQYMREEEIRAQHQVRSSEMTLVLILLRISFFLLKNPKHTLSLYGFYVEVINALKMFIRMCRMAFFMLVMKQLMKENTLTNIIKVAK